MSSPIDVQSTTFFHGCLISFLNLELSICQFQMDHIYQRRLQDAKMPLQVQFRGAEVSFEFRRFRFDAPKRNDLLSTIKPLQSPTLLGTFSEAAAYDPNTNKVKTIKQRKRNYVEQWIGNQKTLILVTAIVEDSWFFSFT